MNAERTAAGRTLYLGLQLLDRQIVDRHERPAGKVDDIELDLDERGQLFVTAILTGPGVLARRMRRLRYGGWLERVVEMLSGDRYVTRLPLGRVSDIGSHVTVAADRTDLATSAIDQWVIDHVIGHIPGNRDAPE